MPGPPEREARGAEPRASHGFTLIELMLVLLIIGTVAAVAVPMAIPRQAGGAAATEQDLVGLYATARRAAVVRAATTTLHLELATGSFVLLGERPGLVEADTLRSGAVRLPAGVGLAGGRRGWVWTVFDASGRAHGDRIFIITEGEHRELLLDPRTATRTPR